MESYTEQAEADYNAGQDKLKAGNEANELGDKLDMTTVVFAVALFLLGIVTTFDSRRLKIIIVVLSVAAIALGVVVGLSVPVHLLG
jgi:hypothetical protein